MYLCLSNHIKRACSCHSRAANIQFAPFSIRDLKQWPESRFAENSLFQERVVSNGRGVTVQKISSSWNFKNVAWVRQLNWKRARGRLQVSREDRIRYCERRQTNPSGSPMFDAIYHRIPLSATKTTPAYPDTFQRLQHQRSKQTAIEISWVFNL
jgi:hypothetical protein